MTDYNPVDVCHYCNDRMYEYLKQKIHEKIEMLQLLNQPYALRLLESLLDESLLDNEEKK